MVRRRDGTRRRRRTIAGFSFFDAFFPSAYPACAPKVRFKTTGGGRARMNPNLYKDGKVCLSLLGTWSAREGRDVGQKRFHDVAGDRLHSVAHRRSPIRFSTNPASSAASAPRMAEKSDEYNRQIREHT